MYKYCPVTGERLRRVAEFPEFWCTVYESSAGGYLEVGHARWVYPLVSIGQEVVARLQNSPSDVIELAFKRLEKPDCKSISTMAFEQTILGCYEPAQVGGNGQSDGSLLASASAD